MKPIYAQAGKIPPKRLTPYGSFAAVSLLECGGFKSILPCLGVRSDAACRVVVKRMREERFNHALPVLVVVRFLRGGLRGVFCPWRERAGGGAFGRGPVRATPATPVCGLLRREGVARRRQKPWGRRQGRAFFPPFLWRSKERGRGGGGGAQPPPGVQGVGIPCVLRCEPRQDLHERCRSARADTRGRAGTRSARHRPYREHHVKPRNG